MILILEGCDAVGKTTFAKTLSEKTGFEIVKGSSFEISTLGRDIMFEYMMELLDKDNIIIDRFFYSNLVYGKLYNYPMMSPDQYDKLVEKLDRKAIVIYLHAQKGVIKYRMEKRGDDMIEPDKIDSILESYRQEMYGDFRPKMRIEFDTGYSDMNIASSMISEMIKLDETRIFIKKLA